MNENVSLGRIAGIHVGFNWSLLVIAALIAWSLAVGLLPTAAPGHTPRRLLDRGYHLGLRLPGLPACP